MEAIRTGPGNSAAGEAPAAGPSCGPGTGQASSASGGALGNVPLPSGGLAGRNPSGQGLDALNALGSLENPSHGVGQVFGSPQIGFGPYRGGPTQSSNQRRMERLFIDQRVTGWGSSCVRACWVIMGCFPPPIDRQALQGYKHDAIEVTNEVPDMLVTCRDIRPTVFNSPGGSSGALPMATHLRLMAEAFVTIARRGVVDDPAAVEKCQLRVDPVVRAFIEAVNMVELYTRENFGAMQLDHNRAIIEFFLVKDVQAYVRSVSVFAEHIYRANPFRSTTGALPRCLSLPSRTSAPTFRPGA